MLKILFSASLFLLLAGSNTYSQEYEIADGSFVAYVVKAKALGFIPNTIVGINRNVSGKFQLKPGNTTIQLTIPVKSFRSANSTRDENICEILKCKEFPKIKFLLKKDGDDIYQKVMEQDSGKFTIKGELTVAGETKQYSFPVRFEKGSNSKIKFETEIIAKFTDFKIDPPTLGAFIKTSPDRLLLKGVIIIKKKN